MAAELEAELPAFDRGLLECSAEEIAAVRARSGRGRAAGSGQPGGTLMAGSFLPPSLPPVPGIEGLRRARAGGVRGCWGGELVGETGINPWGSEPFTCASVPVFTRSASEVREWEPYRQAVQRSVLFSLLV